MQLANQITTKHTRQPRTILSFCAAIIGLVLAAAVAIVLALAANDASTYLIPVVLIVAAVIVVAIILGVLLMAVKDPSKLMLGQVTGDEFIRVQQQVMLGDSIR